MNSQIHLMSNKPGTVERAYQLAREGKSMGEIRVALRAEGYTDVTHQILSPTLASDLRRIGKHARAAATPQS